MSVCTICTVADSAGNVLKSNKHYPHTNALTHSRPKEMPFIVRSANNTIHKVKLVQRLLDVGTMTLIIY